MPVAKCFSIISNTKRITYKLVTIFHHTGAFVKVSLRSIMLTAGVITTSTSYALPIDWNGSLGIDTNIIMNARKTSDNCGGSIPNNGSQCIVNTKNDARFQTYVLKLNPSILVNDSATVKAEISTGSIRGGFLGENTTWGGEAASSYYHTHTDGNNSLAFNQIYAELYGDTGLFRVGKFSKHFGLGAILNGGKNSWDRFYTQYDGIEAELKLGNFTATPIWAKIYSDQNLPHGQADLLEKGLTAQYDNSESNMKVGLYYGLRESGSDTTFYNNATSNDINIIDIYFEKKWDKFQIALEIPMISGKIGNAYYTTASANFDSKAYIFESSFELNPRWVFELNAGLVQGDDGTTNDFEGAYLHPNYKIANILFAYDYQGFNVSNRNIFQSSLANAQYVQFGAKYLSDSWNYKLFATIANANQVAKNGESFYDHENRSLIASANEDQAVDLGYELDFEFDYIWNPSILISGSVNYLKVGDYFAFDNDANSEISLSNVTSYKLNMSVNF